MILLIYLFVRQRFSLCDGFSDVDPGPDLRSDPVESAFIWVSGSISRGIKCRENQSLSTNFLGFFRRKLYFSSQSLKKVAYL